MNRSERPALVVLVVVAVTLLLFGGWSLRPQASVARVVTDAGPVVPAPVTCLGYVALTFDDGPKPLSPLLLRLLADRGIPAAFFYTGQNAAAHPDIVRTAVAAGHQIGNHTWDHPDLRRIPAAKVADELRRTNEVLTPMTGPVSLFRSPFGGTDASIRATASGLGLSEVLWTVDSKDFEARTVQQVIDHSRGLTDGGVLLLHDGNELTLRALPRIINAYHRRGLCFGRLTPTGRPQTLSWQPDLPFAFRAAA
jgi:peptidoglycan/xylan/chitin deacetylase (PgdA/CDA1 family)